MTVGVRAVWLRLLVTALLCVVGLARPLAPQSGALAELRASEPMHLSAASREAEPSLRKRGPERPDGDRLFIIDEGPREAGPDASLADRRAPRPMGLASGSVERPRARGPPVARATTHGRA